MRQFVFTLVLVSLVAASSIAWYRAVAARQIGVPVPELQALLLPQPRPLTDFELADHRNAPFGREQLLGHWTMLFFGYTHCPDICPTTMLTLKQAGRELVQSGGMNPRMVLISVDPLRDDSISLGRYVGHFGEEFLGVHGTDEQLQTLAGQIGAMYERDDPDADGNYQVAHSGSIFVVNPDGGLHAVFSAPHKPTYIAAKMAAITNHYNAP